MKTQTRRAVSPIIATLLLIAIAVASGVLVYVFTGSLAGNLTKSGGSQVTDQVSMDAYNFNTLATPTLYLRDTGSTTVSVASVFFNGNLETVTTNYSFTNGSGCTSSLPVCAPGGTTTLAFIGLSGNTAGAAYPVKIVMADGSTFSFTVVAGSTG